MKSVLISIQPKWCELIASGKKTIEVRKTKPKLETPFKVYIYCTKGDSLNYLKRPFFDNYQKYWVDNKAFGANVARANGKVIGEFVCDCIANYEAELWDDETFESIREFYEPDDFAEYGEYEYKPVADNSDDFWKENMLCKASCLTIEELRAYLGAGFTEFYGWGISDLVIYDEPKCLGDFHHCGVNYHFDPVVTKPPQSWCYVEKVGEG